MRDLVGKLWLSAFLSTEILSLWEKHACPVWFHRISETGIMIKKLKSGAIDLEMEILCTLIVHISVLASCINNS